MHRLLITLGEPLSVNAEILLACRDLVQSWPGTIELIGALKLWQDELAFFKQDPLENIRFIDVADHKVSLAQDLSPKERGKLALKALEWASVQSPEPGEKLAVITLPIDKHNCSLAGFHYPGQTEFFTEHWDGESVMILAGSKLRVGLATNHLPLRSVAEAITSEVVERKIVLLHQSLCRDFAIKRPRIAVAALNPHCGDKGLFGNEDDTVVLPGITKAKARGINVEGPLPADTAFFHAYSGHYDAVLAMYHDQGLAPLKTVHFYDAVNVSGGLKYLRVSPDHGPAGDLYHKGLARSDSLRLCFDTVKRSFSKRV